MFRGWAKPIFTFLGLFICTLSTAQNNIVITSDFPGGNIELVGIDKDMIMLRPDNSNIKGEWFY